MTEWVKQYEKDHKIPDFFKLSPPTDDKQSGSADAIYLAMKDFIKKIAPNSKLNTSSQPGTPHDEDGQNYVGR